MFPRVPEEQDKTSSMRPGAPSEHASVKKLVNIESGKSEVALSTCILSCKISSHSLWKYIRVDLLVIKSDLQVNYSASQVSTVASTLEGENLWIEGLVPGIDFCNHGNMSASTIFPLFADG